MSASWRRESASMRGTRNAPTQPQLAEHRSFRRSFPALPSPVFGRRTGPAFSRLPLSFHSFTGRSARNNSRDAYVSEVTRFSSVAASTPVFPFLVAPSGRLTYGSEVCCCANISRDLPLSGLDRATGLTGTDGLGAAGARSHTTRGRAARMLLLRPDRNASHFGPARNGQEIEASRRYNRREGFTSNSKPDDGSAGRRQRLCNFAHALTISVQSDGF